MLSRKPVSASRKPRAAAVVSLSLLTVGSLTACNADVDGDKAIGNPFADETSASPEVPQVSVTANVTRRKPVRVDKVVKLTADQGTLTDVRVRSANGKARIAGALADDGTSWKASDVLEPGMTYRVKATAEDENGLSKQFARTFKTEDLTLDEQTYPTLVPGDGATVGVAMPVVLRFDVPVKNHASFERHLSVTTTPAQKGTWHWVSDNEVRWRPKNYWKPGTKVDVEAAINSVPAGGGIFGQEDRSSSFTIGDSHGHEGQPRQPPDEGAAQRQAAAHHPDHGRQARLHRPGRAPR